MFRLFVQYTLATRVSMPAVWTSESMVYEREFVPLCKLSLQNYRYWWYDVSRYKDVLAALVSRYLASH